MIVHSSLNPTTDCVTYLQQLLQSSVDSKQSVLLLWSGGSVQTLAKQLCVFLSQFEDLSWLHMSLIDERYSPPNHQDSNEKVIRDTGIIDLVKKKGGHWQPVLTGKSIAEETTQISEYFASQKDKTIIGVFGVGEDSHTAGMLPMFDNQQQFDQLFKPQNHQLYSAFNLDQLNPQYPNPYKQRITLNINGIQRVTHKIVFAIGDKKREILKNMQDQTINIFQCPAKLLNQPGTHVFTDHTSMSS